MSKDGAGGYGGYSNTNQTKTQQAINQLEQRIDELEKQNEMMEKVLEMVMDNTKMPHQHTDPQLRLYCLAERAKEVLDKE